MKNNLLSELIESLNPSEAKTLSGWLKVDGFNSRPELAVLLEYWVEQTKYLGIEPDRERLFASIFPKEPYNDQKFRLYCSYLLKKIETWLVWKEIQQAPGSDTAYLLAAYRKRGLARHFGHTQRNRIQALDSQPARHAEYYWTRYCMEQEAYLWESAEGRTRAHNLQALDDALVTAFLGIKLRQACWTLAHQAVYNAQYKLALIDPVLEEASKPIYDTYPAVAVYREGLKVLAHPQRDDYFSAFKQCLLDNFDAFPMFEMRDLLLLGINFCIRQININRVAFLAEALDLYKKGLETGLLLDKGHLSRFAFNNIVGIALRTEELAWVEEFVAVYRTKLEPAYSESTYYLNAARISFARKRYDEALRQLQRADYDDLINNMVAKTLQLKIYYELGEYDLLDSHLRTMQTYIRRRRTISYHQLNYTNIIRYTQKLLNLSPFDKNAQLALREEISATEPLTEKEWLLKHLRREA